jgi:hypothetical protein
MNEINQPDICVKSGVFESFIRKRLFPDNKYELLSNNNDTSAEINDIPEIVSKFYYQFKSRESGREFYIVARYLASITNVSIEWCRIPELNKYREMDTNLPVYITIGFGPQPAAPRHVIMFPVKNVRFNKVLHSYIEKYKISISRSVDEKDLS